MKRLFALALLLNCTIVTGQDLQKMYTNERHKVVIDVAEATHFRKIEVNDAQIIVRDYYLSNDTLAMEGIFRAEENELINDGVIRYYYENGTLREIGTKKGEKERGIWKTYYENGIQESEIDYNEDETLYIQHWDEHGKPELKDGYGIFKSLGYKGVPHYTEVENSKRVTSYTINNSDTVYIVVQSPAEYSGGMPELYRFVGTHLKYPAKARRMGTEGTVFIEFIVLKDGSIDSPKVVKGIGAGCDEAALNCFTSEMKWTPGLVRGKPVNSKFVMPIKFKLGY